MLFIMIELERKTVLFGASYHEEKKKKKKKSQNTVCKFAHYFVVRGNLTAYASPLHST